MPATSNNVPLTVNTLNAIKSSIAGILWGSEAAFSKIEFYDAEDLGSAFEELRIYGDRICLIIPSGDDWESEELNGALISKPKRQFLLLISDRNPAGRMKGLTGDGTRPGVLTLKDLTVIGLSGLLTIGNTSLKCAPGRGDIMELAWKEDARRICWAQEFELTGGIMKCRIGGR
jgi:hypothetical protein